MNEQDPQTTIQGFIEYLVKTIVNVPDEVIVERNMNSFDETYLIHVSPDDMGIVIGKSGKNINAIRNLVSIKAGAKKIFVHIAETL